MRSDVMDWRSIDTAPKNSGRQFLVIGVNVMGGTYTTDLHCVWTRNGEFVRWPHKFPPTHWMPIPLPSEIDNA